MADYTKTVEAALALVPYSTTTTETINENFKDIMGDVQTIVENEFTSGRITGTDYANVYLGALQTALQLASQVETFEAKRASHERQWKLKVVDSLTSQHAMISNVLGTLDEANILPILRDAFNDLYESIAPAWAAGTYSRDDRVLHTTKTWVCVAGSADTPGTTTEEPSDTAADWREALLWT